jgi:Zn-finger nucleic acid-binding protein
VKRKCPWGHGSLSKAKIIGIEVDYCPECGGIFFDKGEFKRITKVDLVTGRREKEYKIPCPACSSDMHEFSHNLLTLDSSAFYCRKCEGLFIPGKTMQKSFPEIEKISPEHETIKALITVALLERIHGEFEKISPSEIFCPFDNNPLMNYELKNEWSKKTEVKRCGYCGGMFFQRGNAYSVDKEAVLKIDEEQTEIHEFHHNSPDCPVCRKKMRKFINPAIKIDGVFICSFCYGMWFERGRVKKFKEFVESRKMKYRSKEDRIAVTIVKKLGPEKAMPYLNAIYYDLKKKADEEAKKPSVPKIAFLSFLFSFLPPPLRVALLFAEDILYTIKDFLDKRKGGD